MNITGMNQVNTEDQDRNGNAGLFTQEQVNAIVSKRLKEQKAALAAELDQREKDINKREMAIKAAELLSAKGLSRDLASVLKYDTEEELQKAVDTISNMQGMKVEQDSGRSGRHILENKLPAYNPVEAEPDQFKKAFGLD
nr:MAG TPA: Major head protein [Caudoviricetes sp.]